MTHYTHSNHSYGLSSSSIISNSHDNSGPAGVVSSSSSSGGGGGGGFGATGGGLLAEHASSLAGHLSKESGPSIVPMSDRRQTQHQEAYYLFFVGSVGIALNLLVITMIFLRRNLRRMTSAFLVHASVVNLVKAMFCIPFGLNLLSGADGTDDNQPGACNFQGSGFIVLVTTSAVNMVAMICTEAYTFGEVNVGGNSHGTTCCILFGILVVYISSVILHLGPTLIGGDIVYNPDIGSCAFRLGSMTGYVANVMWILIITFALVGVGHFLNKFYKEIQLNRPNRVSMLVRHSITIGGEEAGRKPSACTVHEMTQEAMHRAKIFVITAIAFVLCWYPLFLLILIDQPFKVSPKVYQAFNFIAWTQSTIEPLILIFFDRNINLLSRYMYCDREGYTASQIAYLMSQTRMQQQQQQQQHHHHHSNLEDDTSFGPEDNLTLGSGGVGSGAMAYGGSGGGGGAVGGRSTLDRPSNSHNLSMEIEDVFHNAAAGTSSSRGDSGNSLLAALAATPVCRHCSPHASPREDTPLRGGGGGGTGGSSTSNSRSLSHSATPSASSPRDMQQSMRHFKPVAEGRSDTSLEMNFTYDPVRLKDIEDDVQC